MREFDLESYNYNLPEDLIARYPMHPKEEAKLLVFDRKTKKIVHTSFKYLFDFVPKDYLFVFNDTKVVKARVFGKKKTGGRVEILFHRKFFDGFLVQIGGRVRVGDIIFLKHNFYLKVCRLLENGFRLVKCFHFNQEIFEIFEMCELIGHVPLPPYIKRDDEELDIQEYQSVFAKNYGAVAAPTASLHFSNSMMQYVLKKYQYVFLTLHVGAGTFMSVESKDIREHKIHSELLLAPKKSIETLRQNEHIICVGTTAMRSVEFLARIKDEEYEGECDIFLHLGNPPIKTSALLTNFHLPKSSLIMLVSSMVGLDTCMWLYDEAIKYRYRFYSYGDGMLIL